jgi:hypothetical protein
MIGIRPPSNNHFESSGLDGGVSGGTKGGGVGGHLRSTHAARASPMPQVAAMATASSSARMCQPRFIAPQAPTLTIARAVHRDWHRWKAK